MAVVYREDWSVSIKKQKSQQKNFSSKMSKIKYAKDNENPFKFDCWSKKYSSREFQLFYNNV